jgi:hypothetical protein
MLLAGKIAISLVGNPNMVRDEKDFEIIIIAQGQKQDLAWVAFALIPKIGALLFDKRKLRWMTGLGVDSDRYVEIFDSSRPLAHQKVNCLLEDGPIV